MAPRANWKGYLRLSLVSCAVALYPASSSSSRVSFNRINRKTGNRLKQQNLDSETGEPVDSSDVVRGYEVAKGDYIQVEDEDLEAVKIESSRTIEIAKFVPKSEVDPRYMETPYYIAPDDRVAHEPFAVIREAMRDKKVVAIGRVVIARRERIAMLEPFENGILATLLRYGYEVREAAPYFDEIPKVAISQDMTELAKMILDKMSGHFDPAEFVDRYEDAVVEMLKEKKAGHVIEPRAEPVRGNVIDLMEALKRSVEEAARRTGAAPAQEAPKPKAASKERASKSAKAAKRPAAKRARG
ncbi:MAG: Ku protein [Hyphomicrobiales bacterium]|nr:Ku protein [Hyphomicrobiales bacterium]